MFHVAHGAPPPALAQLFERIPGNNAFAVPNVVPRLTGTPGKVEWRACRRRFRSRPMRRDHRRLRHEVADAEKIRYRSRLGAIAGQNDQAFSILNRARFGISNAGNPAAFHDSKPRAMMSFAGNDSGPASTLDVASTTIFEPIVLCA